MQVTVIVNESEFLSRTYKIDCGRGNQFVYWLATTACMLFGQEHYPPGIYIPNLLTKEDVSIIPHPRYDILIPILIRYFRKRIHQSFSDGDVAIVTLKNRSKPQTEDEQDWYEKAFGKKRNIMKFTLLYKPLTEQIKKGNFEFFIKVKYQMFPEMEDEYNPSDYQTEFTKKM